MSQQSRPNQGICYLQGGDHVGVVEQPGYRPGSRRRQGVPDHDIAALLTEPAHDQHARAAADVRHVDTALCQALRSASECSVPCPHALVSVCE